MTFVKGESGNPAGRPPGARNRSTLIAEGLLDANGVAVMKMIVERAVAGDPAAMRLCMDRIVPRRRGRAAPIDLPRIESCDDVRAAVTAIVAAAAAGEITPAEGVEWLRLIERAGRVIQAIGTSEAIDRRPADAAKNTSKEQNTSEEQAGDTMVRAAEAGRAEADEAAGPDRAEARDGRNTSEQQAQKQRAQPAAGSATPDLAPPPAGTPRPADQTTSEIQGERANRRSGRQRLLDGAATNSLIAGSRPVPGTPSEAPPLRKVA
jgi:hypothetical protein